MLPALFLELTSKASWLLAVALPEWLGGRWSQDLGANTFAIGMIAIVIRSALLFANPNRAAQLVEIR